MDRYAVIGNPVAHSKSPYIHAAFARQTGQRLSYEALPAPLDAFHETVEHFRATGGRGVNVTVPFKQEAYLFADRHTERAAAAGAVNTLAFDEDGILGDNTDGAGLVYDLTHHLARQLEGTRILLLGAGGAARGVMQPLLDALPASLTITNRTVEKAAELLTRFGKHPQASRLNSCAFRELDGQRFDIVINATAASLDNKTPDIPLDLYAPNALAYDMMYGRTETPFLQSARACGAQWLSDGLGMLVEQAAESFLLWRGIRPETRTLLSELKQHIMSE